MSQPGTAKPSTGAHTASSGSERPSARPERLTRDQEISRLAYFLWEARGHPLGNPEEDWFHAEQDYLSKESATRKIAV